MQIHTINNSTNLFPKAFMVASRVPPHHPRDLITDLLSDFYQKELIFLIINLIVDQLYYTTPF